MPTIHPQHTFNASFEDIHFTPDGHKLWLLAEHQLITYHLDDRTQHVLWQDDTVSFQQMCFSSKHDVAFALGRQDDAHIVLVELALHTGQEQRRVVYDMSTLLGKERFDIFTQHDYLWIDEARAFTHNDTPHIIFRGSDECGELFIHWSNGLDAQPVLIEISPEGVHAFTHCLNTDYVIIDDALYDLTDQCIVTSRPQLSSALRLNPSTHQTLHCANNYSNAPTLSWTSTSSDDMTREIHPEHISEEDGWSFPSHKTIATSADAQWLICLDAWYDDIPEGCDDLAAHIGVWNTRTGKQHAQCFTKTFAEFGGRLQLSPNQRLVCVSYDDTIELFSLDLPTDETHWTPNTQHLHDYNQTPDCPPLKGQWSECPLQPEAITALDELDVIYTGFGREKRSHQLSGSWVNDTSSWEDIDPMGQFNVIAPMVWCIISHLQWPTSSWSIWDRSLQESIGIEFIGGASEQLDCVVDGRRRLIHFIAYTDLQHFYGVDLLERSDDVPIYTLDHDFGDGACIEFHTFAEFIYALKQEPDR